MTSFRRRRRRRSKKIPILIAPPRIVRDLLNPSRPIRRVIRRSFRSRIPRSRAAIAAPRRSSPQLIEPTMHRRFDLIAHEKVQQRASTCKERPQRPARGSSPKSTRAFIPWCSRRS